MSFQEFIFIGADVFTVGKVSSSIPPPKSIRCTTNLPVKGFKIDIRFVLDKAGKTYDVDATGLGQDGKDDKILRNEGKLVREGKDLVDCLLSTLHSQVHNHILGWIIQIDVRESMGIIVHIHIQLTQSLLSAAEGEISTVHLAANGVYLGYLNFDNQRYASLQQSSRGISDDEDERIDINLYNWYSHMLQTYKLLPTVHQKDDVIGTCFQSMSNQHNIKY